MVRMLVMVAVAMVDILLETLENGELLVEEWRGFLPLQVQFIVEIVGSLLQDLERLLLLVVVLVMDWKELCVLLPVPHIVVTHLN
tara:strand:- start:373 stop:627 length:255 start_codon:yes stop_codon:yes gene_type:complete